MARVLPVTSAFPGTDPYVVAEWGKALQIRLSRKSGGTFPGAVNGLNVFPRGHAKRSFEQCAESCGILISQIGRRLGYGCPCHQLWKRCKKARLLSPCDKAKSCFPAKHPRKGATRYMQ